MLLLPSTILATWFLAGPVNAGSRLWQPSIPQVRASASAISKRAISILPDVATGGIHRWPDKTLTYAFANDVASVRLEGMFDAGKRCWGLLDSHGFRYKEISTSKCDRNRLGCLKIYYNPNGVLSSTVGIPALDDRDADYEGPVMHLSDSFAVGNRNPGVNAAHEIGHAWGLFHEHQNEKWWKTSREHAFGQSSWSSEYRGDVFHTNQFRCENFIDYERKFEEAGKVKDPVAERALLCTSRSTAAKYKFSAMEWLPVKNDGKDADPTFDEDSLMLYPSGSGGRGFADETTDERLAVMTYENGRRIPIRHGPSPMDIQKLLTLYDTATKPVSELHNKKGSKKKTLFERMKDLSTRAGHTMGGLC